MSTVPKYDLCQRFLFECFFIHHTISRGIPRLTSNELGITAAYKHSSPGFGQESSCVRDDCSQSYALCIPESFPSVRELLFEGSNVQIVFSVKTTSQTEHHDIDRQFASQQGPL